MSAHDNVHPSDAPWAGVHYVEETATVYLRLSADTRSWELDNANFDGQPLFGYDNGPQHTDTCPCAHTRQPDDVQRAGDTLADRVSSDVPIPDVAQLLHLLADAQGYALIGPHELTALRRWDAAASAELEQLAGDDESALRRRDERAADHGDTAWQLLRGVIGGGS